MQKIAKRYLGFIWHYGQAYSLLTVPLSGFSIALSGFTFLAVLGFRFPWYAYLLFFLVVLFLLSAVGYAMKKSGLLAYYQSMTNKQSPELLEILERVKEIQDGR